MSDDMAAEMTVRDTKMVRSRVLEILKNNTESYENGNKAAQDEKREHEQEMLRKKSYRHRHIFLKRL